MDPPSNQLYSNEADHFRHEGASGSTGQPMASLPQRLSHSYTTPFTPEKFQPASQSSAVETSLELEGHAKRYLI
jgi:hypothetical protein